MPPLIATSLILSPLIYIGGHWIARLARIFTLTALCIIWLLLYFVSQEMANVGEVIYSVGMMTFHFNGLSLFITVMVLLLTTLVTIYSGSDIEGHIGEEKYYAMLLLMTGAIIGMVCAGDLFNLWMWFETTAISSYLLVAFYNNRAAALAACAKYLIQTATGSVVVLFGIALVFAQTGTLRFDAMQVPVTPLMVVAGTLFIMGFGVKIALGLTYTWLPDTYVQAPTGISALLSGIVTVSGVAALLRVLALLNAMAMDWGAVLIGLGTLNIVVGNVLALRQDEVKRIFAYSSISHIGFIVLGLGIGLYTQHISGFQSGLLHLFNHGLMKALAFLAVGTVAYTRFRENRVMRVNDLKGLSKSDPVTSFALTVACLSLAGIPPLAGFMSKWQIFAAGLMTSSPVLIALTIFAALNSVFSLAYYFPIINAMFQAETRPAPLRLPAAMRIPIVVLTAGVLVLGIYPGLVDGIIVPASKTLMLFFGG